jgi:phage tail-like protein
MSDFGFSEAYRTNEFLVEIEGIESPGITNVTGLEEGSVEAIDQPDGGSNVTHKISSGLITYDDITLERNIDGTPADEAFRAWFTEMFKLDGTGVGSRLRRNGSLVKLQFGQEVMRLAFEGAWIKSSKFSDLDAGTSALFKQTIVLAVERKYRV